MEVVSVVVIVAVIEVAVVNIIKVRGKATRNRPGVARWVRGGLGSQISMTFGM
jgi:hypothetical protein